MNHQRTSFTPVPTHQDGATVSAFQFDRRIGHLQCWRRRGHTFNERRWNDLIPRPIDQNWCAHWRNPMDMMRQG